MDRRVVIAASVVAVVSLVFAVHIYQVSATGSSFMSPVLSAGLSSDLDQATAEETGYREHIIVSFEPTSQALSVQDLNVRAQTIRSLTVRNLTVYGFEFEYEEVIADFGMAIGTAPAENIGRIASASQVRAVSRNPFISIEPLQQAGGYSSFNNLREFHEVDELPRAENVVVCVPGDSIVLNNRFNKVGNFNDSTMLTLDTKKGLLEESKTNKKYTGKKEIYRVVTSSREIEATLDHPFLVLPRDTPGIGTGSKSKYEWFEDVRCHQEGVKTYTITSEAREKIKSSDFTYGEISEITDKKHIGPKIRGRYGTTIDEWKKIFDFCGVDFDSSYLIEKGYKVVERPDKTIMDWVETRELNEIEEGDLIPVVNDIDIEGRKVKIYPGPEDYVKLTEEGIEKAQEARPTYIELAKSIESDRKLETLRRGLSEYLKGNKGMKYSLFKDIFKELDLPLREEYYKPSEGAYHRHTLPMNYINEDVAQILGFYLGDGSLHNIVNRKNTCHFVLGARSEEKQIYRNILENTFDIETTTGPQGQIIACSTALSDVVKRLGMDKKSKNRIIPIEIMNLPKKQLASFVRGYLDADGHVEHSGKTVGFTSHSRELLERLKLALLRFGIQTGKINSYEVEGELPQGGYYEGTRHSMKVLRQSSDKFAEIIGSEYRDLSDLKEEFDKRNSLQVKLNEDISFERVKDIEKIGKSEVYDFDTETDTFVVNGVVTHNCVVDSGAPRKPWITKAVTARGDSPYIGFYHGAAVCKTVHEVAPSAKITSVKTLGDAGTARLSTIIEGLSMAVHTEPQADVINLSLGTDASGYNPMDTACDTLVREYGVKIVCAAGNTFQGEQTSPATAGSTLSVGAIGTDGDLTEYSASEYDVVAIGDVQVEIAGVASARGTSFAAPVLSGMTARWIAGQEGVDKREIDMVGSVTQAGKVFMETEEQLPVVKGSNLAETSASTKRSPSERAIIPIAVFAFSGFVILWSFEDEIT